MRPKPRLRRHAAEIETIPTTCIQNDVAGRRREDLRNPPQQRFGNAPVMQSTPRRNGLHRVPRLFRPPVLWLEQIRVPAAGNVKRMSARTEQAAFFPNQRQVAFADGAKEHSSEFTR